MIKLTFVYRNCREAKDYSKMHALFGLSIKEDL